MHGLLTSFFLNPIRTSVVAWGSGTESDSRSAYLIGGVRSSPTEQQLGRAGGGIWSCLGYNDDIFFAASQLHMAYLYSSGLFKLGHSWRTENKCAFSGDLN